MWVIFATKAMLSVAFIEEKDEPKINSIKNDDFVSQLQYIQSQSAGFRAYSDASYNPDIAKEEAGLGGVWGRSIWDAVVPTCVGGLMGV